MGKGRGGRERGRGHEMSKGRGGRGRGRGMI